MKKLLWMASLVLAGCSTPETATLVVKSEPNSEVVYWGAGKDETYSYYLGQQNPITILLIFIHRLQTTVVCFIVTSEHHRIFGNRQCITTARSKI